MRSREAGETTPKPMVTIGYRPLLWHLMKDYATFVSVKPNLNYHVVSTAPDGLVSSIHLQHG
jgi:NDP-sugar pyrophosphorylase family protein